MTEINTPIQVLLEKAENYSTTSIQLLKLKTIRNTSDALATVITQVILYIIIGVFFLFTNIALAIWLGNLLCNLYLGFLVVGAFYGAVTLVFCFFSIKCIKVHFQNFFISKLNN